MKRDVFGDLTAFENVLRNLRIEADGHFRRGQDTEVHGDKMWYCYTPFYQGLLQIVKNFSVLLKFLNIERLSPSTITEVEGIVARLNNIEWVRKRTNIINDIARIEELFMIFKDNIYESIGYLSDFEKERLSEAIHNYLEGCYNSCVAMAVTSIEFKLLGILKSANPENAHKLEEFTLGTLINEYLKNKEKYKNVIPKRHEPLLELCNTYRIFSVHPKKEKISNRITESVLNLTFEFLLDTTLKVKG